MILGFVLPAALTVFALVDIFAFRVIRAQGSITPKAYLVWGAAAIALPILAYVVLNFIVPEWGAIEVF